MALQEAKTEVVKSINVTLQFCEVRSGRALTIIELMKDGKHSGRDLVIRTNNELEQLILALTQAKEFWIEENGK